MDAGPDIKELNVHPDSGSIRGKVYLERVGKSVVSVVFRGTDILTIQHFFVKRNPVVEITEARSA